MKKQITFGIVGILALSFIANSAYGQNFDVLRQKPNIAEDEIIICTKDVTNTGFKGQISCIISPIDDLLDKQTADKIYKLTQSLDNTFEMGLID